MDYKDLVKICPELGEVFAEIENRLLYLENRDKPYSYFDGLEKKIADLEQHQSGEQIQWVSRQWDAVNQLNAHILHLENKLNEHIDKSKRKKEGKY